MKLEPTLALMMPTKKRKFKEITKKRKNAFNKSRTLFDIHRFKRSLYVYTSLHFLLLWQKFTFLGWDKSLPHPALLSFI